MKQVAQRPSDGRVTVEHVPPPASRPGWVVVQNRYSLISAGTERSKIELGKKSVVAKARARPDLVRKAIDKARAEGFRSTLAVARDRLAGLDAIGYSSAGTVQEVGIGVEGIAPGDRVACAGAGWANHASIVAVPKNLVARVPDGVDLAEAAYSTVGAIALHGVRQADVRLAERVGVVGLGLVGQLAVRLLLASGCDVAGFDLDHRAVELAERAGATAMAVDARANGSAGPLRSLDGCLDAVIVCAAGSSSAPVHLACRLLRSRGRVVVIGDVPIEADRTLMYEKELELRLSRSYGPGRYAPDYEEHGRDLPAEYVRWTEQRNLAAFVALIAAGRIRPSELTTHVFPVDRASDAYEIIEAGGDPRPFGVLLEYPATVEPVALPRPSPPRPRPETGARVGLIGVGGFARSILVPGLARAGASLMAVASERGLSAADAAARLGFQQATTTDELLRDEDVDAVVIATRHANHAELTAKALRAGKAVFVEKPLALTATELSEVTNALAHDSLLMVGFNRRFAPFTESAADLLQRSDSGAIAIRVNAGSLPDTHWLHDPRSGGGRLLGEGCHFIDLALHCSGARPHSVQASARPQPERPLECSDEFTVTLRFANGGLGVVIYTGKGDTRLSKERIEVFAGGESLVIDDFRRLERYRENRRSVSTSRQDKGHQGELERFIGCCRGEQSPPAAIGYIESTMATLAAAESLRTQQPVVIS